jgi:DNA-binding protein H-NS
MRVQETRNKVDQSKGNSNTFQRQTVQFQDNRNQPISTIQKMANDSIQMKPNNTGLPNQLKSGIESLSGHSMDDVKVHYNSSKPAQLNAHAYAQGTDIHVASGQEKHVPHEAWHVVQQKQGRVQPTRQMKGKANINDDAGLEKEADVMGAKALQMKSKSVSLKTVTISNTNPLQMVLATVNPQNGPINLAQVNVGGTGFFTMQNTGQPAGAAVGNAMGFNGALNASTWSGFGKSPRNYHRAHAYAKSFGGGGADSNVAWWPASTEDSWTLDEQEVRGGDKPK